MCNNQRGCQLPHRNLREQATFELGLFHMTPQLRRHDDHVHDTVLRHEDGTFILVAQVRDAARALEIGDGDDRLVSAHRHASSTSVLAHLGRNYTIMSVLR